MHTHIVLYLLASRVEHKLDKRHGGGGAPSSLHRVKHRVCLLCVVFAVYGLCVDERSYMHATDAHSTTHRTFMLNI